jgi:nicotinate-nucleotide adenylyltransferase
VEAGIKRVGIFAGTFDPVHDGHVAFALAAIAQRGLNEVIFLPERMPRGKHHVTDMQHRVEMIRAAIAGHTNLKVVELPEDQFTVAATLPALECMLPDASLSLLVGTDVAHGLKYWANADTLLAKVEIIVAVREGDKAPVGVTATVVHVSHPHVAARHVRGGTSDDIAPKVRDYINQHNLYRV